LFFTDLSFRCGGLLELPEDRKIEKFRSFVRLAILQKILSPTYTQRFSAFFATQIFS